MVKELWPILVDKPKSIGYADVTIFQEDDLQGKPVLRIKLGGVVVCITANLGEMIGGVATGARKHWEDNQDEGDGHGNSKPN